MDIKIGHKFHNPKELISHKGDTLRFLKTIPNDTISLIISSPSYNLGTVYL
jgi:hypothetical protein